MKHGKGSAIIVRYELAFLMMISAATEKWSEGYKVKSILKERLEKDLKDGRGGIDSLA